MGAEARAWRLSRLRLRAALRTLLRHRRANLAYRAWREEMLARYRLSSKSLRATVPAPPREALVQEVLDLQRNYELKILEREKLLAENVERKRHLDTLRGQAFLRLRNFLGR